MKNSNKNHRHIYWFSFYNLDSISGRYRGKYVLEYLNKYYNVTYSFVFPSYKLYLFFVFIKTFLAALFHLNKKSIIVIQKVCTNNSYAKSLKLLNKIRPSKIIYDIDDAEWTRYDPENLNYFIENSHACFVGSDVVYDYCKQRNPNVTLITSPIIDHHIYKTKKNLQFTIGWIGDYSDHKESLKANFFQAIYNINFSMKVVLLGIKNQEEKNSILIFFESKKNIQFEIPLILNWKNEKEIYTLISSFDVGISTLSNSEFDKGKSAFKLKQYLSCGIPVLSSNLGENSKFVNHGINGYLCENSADFYIYINHLKNLNNADYDLMCNNCKLNNDVFSMKTYCELFMLKSNFQ